MAEALKDAGHDIRLAPDGIVALEAIAACIPDAILLDLFLPRLDGYEVVRELKRDARTVAIPLVVVTGAHAAEERAAEIGTPHLLKKPFNISDLISCIQGLTHLAA